MAGKTGLPKKGIHSNVWGLMFNDAMKCFMQNENIILAVNGNNPPTIKAGTRFAVYKTTTDDIESDATGNDIYPASAVSFSYFYPDTIIEPADQTFSWNAGGLPVQSDGTWYLYCTASDSATKFKGAYNISKTESPTWSEDKAGWYSANNYKVLGRFVSTSGVVSNVMTYNNINQKETVFEESADFTVPVTTGKIVVTFTCGAATKKCTLTAATGNKGFEIEVSKGDTGYGPVMIVTEGGTMNGQTVLFLWNQYDTVRLRSNGTNYKIINGFKPYFHTGRIIRSDWTNVHLGNATPIYDTGNGTFQVGDKITGDNGSYGICIYHNAATFTLILANTVCVGSLIFANNERIVGDRSGANALINMASGLKNVDSNIYHGWGVYLKNINVKITISTDGTEANSLRNINGFYNSNASPAQNTNDSILPVDANNIKYQVGADGSLYIDDSGGNTNLATGGIDYYYDIGVYLSD